jgi:hypothetical protein
MLRAHIHAADMSMLGVHAGFNCCMNKHEHADKHEQKKKHKNVFGYKRKHGHGHLNVPDCDKTDN